MAVYATMIRDDPDSRARLRVTPEQLLNFPNYFCLASWIANGTRAPALHRPDLPAAGRRRRVGRLSPRRPGRAGRPVSRAPGVDARHARGRRAPDGRRRAGPDGASASVAARVPAVPYEEKDAAKRLGARWDPGARALVHPRRARSRAVRALASRRPPDGCAARRTARPPANGHAAQADERAPPGGPPTPRAAGPATPDAPPAAKREVRVDYEPPPPPPKLDDSPVRRVVGRRVPGAAPGAHEAPAPDSLRELAFLDRINEIGPAEQHHGAENLPRLYDEDYAILALLDRAGLVPRTHDRTSLSARTRAANAVLARMAKLHRHGLIAQHPIGMREHAREDGKPPLLYSLTRRGMEVAQTRQPPGDLPQARVAADRAGPRRPARPRPARARRGRSSCTASSATLATDHWRTPRYATGRYPVPQAGSGRDRHPITLNEIPRPRQAGDRRPRAEDSSPRSSPTSRSSCGSTSLKLTFDLLVELDLTARPPTTATSSSPTTRSCAAGASPTRATRPRARGRRWCSCARTRAPCWRCAREADEAMTGRIGVMGTEPEHWYSRRARPRVLRRRSRHPPRRPVRARAARAAARAARAAHRQPRARARASRAAAGQAREALTSSDPPRWGDLQRRDEAADELRPAA